MGEGQSKNLFENIQLTSNRRRVQIGNFYLGSIENETQISLLTWLRDYRALAYKTGRISKITSGLLTQNRPYGRIHDVVWPTKRTFWLTTRRYALETDGWRREIERSAKNNRVEFVRLVRYKPRVPYPNLFFSHTGTSVPVCLFSRTIFQTGFRAERERGRAKMRRKVSYDNGNIIIRQSSTVAAVLGRCRG